HAERDASGNPVRAHGTIQDISRYRAAEQQASQDRRLFVDAQRVARLGTWQWNAITGECVWSTMLYELSGVPSTSPVSYNDFLELVHPEDRGWVDRRCQELVAHGRPMELE